jgi:hypothetical protein
MLLYNSIQKSPRCCHSHFWLWPTSSHLFKKMLRLWGLSMYRVRICRPFKEPRNRFPALRGGPYDNPILRTCPPCRLHRLANTIPWNRFLGSLSIYKFGLSTVYCTWARRTHTCRCQWSAPLKRVPVSLVNVYVCVIFHRVK